VKVVKLYLVVLLRKSLECLEFERTFQELMEFLLRDNINDFRGNIILGFTEENYNILGIYDRNFLNLVNNADFKILYSIPKGLSIRFRDNEQIRISDWTYAKKYEGLFYDKIDVLKNQEI